MKSAILSAFALGVLFSVNVAAETGEQCTTRIENAFLAVMAKYDILDSMSTNHERGGDISVYARFTCDFAEQGQFYELNIRIATTDAGWQCSIGAGYTGLLCGNPNIGRVINSLDTAQDYREAKKALRSILRDF